MPCVKGTRLLPLSSHVRFHLRQGAFYRVVFAQKVRLQAIDRVPDFRGLIAFDRSAGKTCLDEVRVITGDADGGFADEEDGSRSDASENRSGVDDRVPISFYPRLPRSDRGRRSYVRMDSTWDCR